MDDRCDAAIFPIGRRSPLVVRRTSLAVALLGALAPTVAAAHVKWFADAKRYPIDYGLVWSDRTFALLAVSLAGLGALYVLQRAVGSRHWPDLAVFRQMAVGAPTLLAVQAAIGLIQAAVRPALFAPNMPLEIDLLGLGLVAVQIAIAFSFILGFGDWIGAIVLILLGPIGFLLFQPFDVLDQLYWAGIGVFVLIVGRFAVESGHARPWFEPRDLWAARAVATLRIIGGVAIVAPALSEKVWNPALGAAFLAERPQFNFMQTYLGLEWFGDDLFVLAAGITEGTIGVLLASGVLTRVVILGMFVPFNLGVPFLPPEELLGHLPIFGIMYLLLVHSSGIAPGESVNHPAPRGGRS